MDGRGARSCEEALVAWTTRPAVGMEGSTEHWPGMHQGILNIELGAQEKGVLVARCVARLRRSGGSDKELGACLSWA